MGFYEWDYKAIRRSDESSAICPNCGTRVYRNGIYDLERAVLGHECNPAGVEAHLVAALNREFVMVRDTMMEWQPFGEWLATSEGQFEQQWAESHR